MLAAMWRPAELFASVTSRAAWRVAGITKMQLAFACWVAGAVVGFTAGMNPGNRWWVMLVAFMGGLSLLEARSRRAVAVGVDDPHDTPLRAFYGVMWVLNGVGIVVLAMARDANPGASIAYWLFFNELTYLETLDSDDEKGEPLLHRAARAVKEAVTVRRPAPVLSGG